MRTSAWTNIDLFALYVFVSFHHKYVFDCRQTHLNTFCWILIQTYAKFMVIFCSHICIGKIFFLRNGDVSTLDGRHVQKSPDNRTMLNHTTLLFTQN